MIQNSKFQIQNSRKGFTLIEVLIVMAIVGILTTAAVINMGRNPDRDVRQEADRLTVFLRSVQNKALAAEKISGATGKVCGLGVNFPDNASAQVFYLETISGSDSKLDVDCGNASMKYENNSYAAKSLLLPDGSNPEKFNLKNNVVFETNPSDIFFLIPHGDFYYNGAIPSSDTTINLSKTSGSDTATVPVTVSANGVIK